MPSYQKGAALKDAWVLIPFVAMAASCGAGQRVESASACGGGFADCDGETSTGCEVNLLTNSHHCGACDGRCRGGMVCINGQCESVVETASSENHLCELHVDGGIACRGMNRYGQLGDGTVTRRSRVVDVFDLEDAVEIVVGNDHSCARRGNGQVSCWGRNHLGQLGDGTASDAPTARPVSVIELPDAEELYAAGHRTCARRAQGQVVCWGAIEEVGGGYREAPMPVDGPLLVADREAENFHINNEPVDSRRVDVAVHGMSRCPYFNKSLKALISVAKALEPDVRLRVEYIGRSEQGKLTSMRGEPEVRGDLFQICARIHGPYTRWLDFLRCQSEDWRQIPGNALHCASKANIDTTSILHCVEKGEGRALLEKSFQVSREAKALGSPTFIIDGERFTGGRRESDFAAAVCPYLADSIPDYCGEHLLPTPVVFTLLSDGRCTQRECDVSAEIRRIKAEVKGARIGRVDFGTPRGRELHSSAGEAMLPLLIVNDEDGRASKGLQSVKRFDGVGDLLVRSLGRFDPIKAEWVLRPVVNVRYLVDERCKTRECELATRFESSTKRQLPTSKVIHIDYHTEEGRALWERYTAAVEAAQPETGDKRPGLPVALFSKALEHEENMFSKLRRRIRVFEEEYAVQLGSWDPTAEICDNGVDDDGDRRVDCRDSDCREALSCRPLKRRRIDLFVMGRCPYGSKVLDAMTKVVDHFGRRRQKIDFNVQFIGRVEATGALTSMRGEDEVEDDLRMICAQRHYGARYEFLNFITCQQKNLRSPSWEQCVQPPMKTDVIRRCAEGDEGQRLLRQSFELAEALGFKASPSTLLNNRNITTEKQPQSIVDAFCAQNKLPECSTPVDTSP